MYFLNVIITVIFRPVGIYKQDYINELYKRYDEIKDATLAPPTPDWCIEDNNVPNNLDDFDDAQDDGSTSSQ